MPSPNPFLLGDLQGVPFLERLLGTHAEILCKVDLSVDMKVFAKFAPPLAAARRKATPEVEVIRVSHATDRTPPSTHPVIRVSIHALIHPLLFKRSSVQTVLKLPRWAHSQAMDVLWVALEHGCSKDAVARVTGKGEPKGPNTDTDLL